MNKYLLLLFTILFSTVLLHADYLRTIRIGSFVKEKDARESLVKLHEFVKKHNNILLLEEKNDFIFGVRKSGKYFITCVEPLRSRKVLQEVLDTLRLEYDGVYVTKLKQKQLSKRHLDVIPDLVVSEKKEESPLLKQFEKPTPQVELKKEENKTVLKEISSTENSDYNIWKYLFFITFLGLLILLRSIFSYRKEIEKANTKVLITNGKLSQTLLEVKEKEKFLSYTSHELRTPMTAIIGLTHLVLEDDLSKTQKDFIQKIESSAQHILSIVNDLLDISKLEESEIKIEKVEFNINNVLKYAVDIVAIQAKNNNVNISLEVEKDVPSLVVGDSLRLGQILINLLSNSVKFTKDGDVKLSVKKLSSFDESITLDFAISDTGIGMTQDQVKSIFESYSQADESISRKFGGTGLGLAISKKLVELMNGKIKVHSKKELGSTFSFNVDFLLKDSQNKRQYRLPSSKLLGKKILLVEAGHNNVISLNSYLNYFNYKVTSIPSFEEVILDKEIHYDIIILNEEKLTKHAISNIKEMQKGEKLKVVIVQELYSSKNRGIYDSLNIDAFLEMPCTQQNILNLIVELYVSKNLDAKSRKVNIKSRLKTFKDKRILVVEDNKLNHKVISGLLSDTNINLTFANNGKEALDLLSKESNFDLVLMDINMPIMNGYEATQFIRNDKKYNALPILALTADAMEESIEKALNCGMQGYITKPIIVDIFYKRILDMFDYKQTEVKTLSSKVQERDDLSELSVSIGLGRCHDDIEFYKTILKDFKIMYINSSLNLEELCKKGKFKEARTKAMDIKDVSLNIGAYNLCEHAATMEYEFEKGSRSEWESLLLLYNNSLEKLFKDIDKYITRS